MSKGATNLEGARGRTFSRALHLAPLSAAALPEIGGKDIAARMTSASCVGRGDGRQAGAGRFSAEVRM
ncbi:hypothetical protein C1708_32145 [Streptomyces sp. DH-12]|nr:hypothetical protein C1708_32145 [Streptomyces sp. DH-12]